jgi:hypothetical protein
MEDKMKDPAVLFYFQDFLVGTEFMTDDEVGKYIRILCHQADKGSLTEVQLQRICRGKIPPTIMEKLSVDDEGKFYQNRMKSEREKRVKHCENQRENINKRWNKNKYDGNTTVIPLENENENININVNIIKVQFENFRKNYPGTKRGTEIEFDNLKKKHRDWKEIIPVLNEKLNYQKSAREIVRLSGGFVPEWKMLQTWINQRCWEEEINTKIESKSYDNGMASVVERLKQIQDL